MRLRYLYFICLVVILASCSKNNGGGGSTPTNTPMVVDIDLPFPNATIMNGTNLRVEGKITDNNIVQVARIEIKNKTSGAILFSNTVQTPNSSLYSFLWNYTVTGVTSSNVTAVIKVTGRDALNNETFQEIEVTLVP